MHIQNRGKKFANNSITTPDFLRQLSMGDRGLGTITSALGQAAVDLNFSHWACVV
jgi:hypothetical protein